MLALSLVASQSAARPTDDSEAFARLISTDALTLDLLDVLGQSSGNRTGAGANYGKIDLALLQGLLGLDLDLGDGLVLPLLGEAGTSVLDLGPLAGAGVLGAYATRSTRPRVAATVTSTLARPMLTPPTVVGPRVTTSMAATRLVVVLTVATRLVMTPTVATRRLVTPTATTRPVVTPTANLVILSRSWRPIRPSSASATS
ncbi:hypothetical protein [Actinotalea caeni]|uniref:hypothetical protein n=1 Tax=Actinotalea caeni TaxID=1348467 RepID=UPI0012E31CA0|nr:hypothetical protein [Actinotalea caeni]